MSDKRKVILDCDPGHDDAFAIMLAAAHLDLLGITTIGGNCSLQNVTKNALKVLEVIGRQDIKVYPGHSCPLVAPLVTCLLYTSDDILFVVEYRRILEVGIIDLYTRNPTSRDIAFLTKTLDKMKQYYRTNLKKYTKYDLEFHMKLYEMTGNPFIIKISNLVYDILSAAMKEAVTERGAEEGIEFHSAMLEYIRNGEIDNLKKLTNELFDQIELCLLYTSRCV